MDEDYIKFINSLPANLKKEDPKYDMRRYWELNGKPVDFQQGLNQGIFSWNNRDRAYHANTIAWNPLTGDAEFVKRNDHPTLHLEEEEYNSPKMENFRNNFLYIKPENPQEFGSYVRRNKWDEKNNAYKGGELPEVTASYKVPNKGLNTIPKNIIMRGPEAVQQYKQMMNRFSLGRAEWGKNINSALLPIATIPYMLGKLRP